MDYSSEMESPREWLLWSGVSALSSSIKRNCFIYYRGIKFFPNQYIILVGPPGIGKGEAIHRSNDLASNAKTINYIKDWHTPQEILEELADGFQNLGLKVGQIVTANVIQDHTCCIMAPELAVFLQNYENMHSLLCAWWDQNKFDYKTKNKGKHVISDMSVSLLGGCVPDYIRSLCRDRLAPITGGFTARTIFVYATDKYQLVKNYFEAPKFNISKLRDELINDLLHISTLKGELKLNKEALNLWEQVYEQHNRRGSSDSDASQNFKSRISSHIIKCAITTSLSESDSLIISADHLQRAIDYIEAIRDKVDVVFRSVGESPVAGIQSKLLAYIDREGMAFYKSIVRFMYRDSTEDQLLQVITMLKLAGLLLEKIDAKGQVYYESTNTTAGSP